MRFCENNVSLTHFENLKIQILNVRFSLAQFCFEGLSTVPPMIEND